MSLPSHAFHYGMLSHFFVDSKLRENSLMILRKHSRISLFPAHCFSKSTPKVPKYGPLLGMLSLFTPGRCLKCMGRGWPLTPWRVGKLNIKQFPGMPRTQTSSNRWKQVFRHEFISLIWLREKGCNLTSASSNKETYIPKRAFQSDHCYCGLPVAEKWCEYCNSPCRTQITKRVQEKYVSNVRNGTE